MWLALAGDASADVHIRASGGLPLLVPTSVLVACSCRFPHLCLRRFALACAHLCTSEDLPLLVSTSEGALSRSARAHGLRRPPILQANPVAAAHNQYTGVCLGEHISNVGNVGERQRAGWGVLSITVCGRVQGAGYKGESNMWKGAAYKGGVQHRKQGVYESSAAT
eukprot:1158975-Pelagomonas_calceolata.AAC.20